MKRSTILCSLLPVLLVLFLCACSASPSGASDGAETPNNIFHELPLPAVTEGQVSVLDARGSRILYVREEKLLSKDGGYAYYETKQVGIYDVDAQKSLAVWEPETPGNYFGGALLDGDAAILALQLDYTNAYPAQFAAMYFGGSQRSLVELTGELQWLLPFSGKEALASYRTEEGAFGVYRLSADGCTDALLLQADANTEPMGGDLAVCGDRFCFSYAKNGQVTLCTVSADGTQEFLSKIIAGEPCKMSVQLDVPEDKANTILDACEKLISGETMDHYLYTNVLVIDGTNAQDYYTGE